MNPHYNQNYTYDDVADILSKIKECVYLNRYTISLNDNRQENIKFINEYNIRVSRQKEILLQMEVTDFCYSLQNIKAGYENETLYVFAPLVILFNGNGKEELVSIYIKCNVVESVTGSMVIIISFHKPNKAIEYLFK